MGDFVTQHFLTDQTGKNCGDFTFSENDLILHFNKELNLNDQPAQLVVSHPKIPGLSWMFLFYQTGLNQYQPKIAYDFPSYLRGDTEVKIHIGGMNWTAKHKFEGSAWLSTCFPPQTLNERWQTLGTCKRVDIDIVLTKIWFRFPVFSVCCHAMKNKPFYNLPDFTNPTTHADLQILPIDPQLGRQLFAHSQVLALNSDWFAQRVHKNKATVPGDFQSISLPFDYQVVLNFLKAVYPNSNFEIAEENVEGLLDMGKEYDVPNLRRQCESFLFKNLEAGSSIVSYHMARKHDMPQLREAALLHLSEMNVSQLRSRVNLDLKSQTPEIQELLLNDLYRNLATSHM